jgi:hypothetical protein
MLPRRLEQGSCTAGLSSTTSRRDKPRWVRLNHPDGPSGRLQPARWDIGAVAVPGAQRGRRPVSTDISGRVRQTGSPWPAGNRDERPDRRPRICRLRNRVRECPGAGDRAAPAGQKQPRARAQAGEPGGQSPQRAPPAVSRTRVRTAHPRRPAERSAGNRRHRQLGKPGHRAIHRRPAASRTTPVCDDHSAYPIRLIPLLQTLAKLKAFPSGDNSLTRSEPGTTTTCDVMSVKEL